MLTISDKCQQASFWTPFQKGSHPSLYGILMPPCLDTDYRTLVHTNALERTRPDLGQETTYPDESRGRVPGIRNPEEGGKARPQSVLRAISIS